MGEGTLPIQCAELLLERGHQILGIVSPDKSISDWAKEKGISHISPKDDLLAFVSQQSFDYLFSIVNGTVLPKEILKLPSQGAINYHDAPLPKYAGVNATSWALMQQEKTHGVSWHRMSEVIDGGDILKQVSLDIAKNETAFTLNGKCYEAAILSFAQLIDELSAGKAVAIPQNLDQLTYFPRSKRPSSGGLLSFNRCAYELDALVRALDFGSYPNPLGLAKLAIGSDFIVVSRLEVLDEFSQASPGTITGIEPDFLKISTSSYEIALRELQTLEGKPLSISDLVKRFGLQVGCRFQDIDLELAKRIEKFDSLIAKHEAFWVERLASLQPLAIPYAKRSLSPAKQKRYASVKMPVLDEVIKFLEERHPTWNSGDFLLAAFVGYLARIGGTACFDIGFRDVELGGERVGTAGFFADYVPCHLEINLEQSFEEIFETVREQVVLTKQHKTYARDAVVRYPQLRSVSELGSEQIFPVVIERVEKLDDHQASPGNELTFIISEDGKECGWFYNAEALDGDSVARMVEQFTIFLQGIVTDSSQNLAYLPLLSKEDRHKILVEWNDTAADYPKDKCIHQLFEEQVERTPYNVAVVFEDQKLTYRELNARANQLAHYLQKLGVGPEVLVGICVERSLEMILGLLGILKAGGAYVPLEPTYPQERLAQLVIDSGMPLLLTQEKLVVRLPENKPHLVCLDADWELIIQESEENPNSDVKGSNLSYVIYTSGTTGEPKGVMIEHKSVLNLAMALNKTVYKEQEKDQLNVSFNGSLAFDTSVKQIIQLLFGHTLEIIPEDLRFDGVALLFYLQHRQIDVFDCTPSQLGLLISAGLLDSNIALQHVLVGGEPINESTWQTLIAAKNIHFYNVYGPTECTVDATVCAIGVSEVKPAIGRPIANIQVYILDSQLQLVPIGVAGELHIGGTGLARGYLNRRELTAEKFIPNPFSDESNAKLYKTGDLVRYLPDGNIEFLGRIDNQVKIRGFRIELGEVEAVLGQHPAVRECVVIAQSDDTENKRLVAYVVPSQGHIIAVDDLRRFLKQKLPNYMIPSLFVLLEVLPLTSNGKVDRKALSALEGGKFGEAESFVAPRTPIEELLAGIWVAVLGLEQVGIHDNFFDIGGHSLKATQVISRVRDVFSTELPIRCLFEFPTVADLSEHIENIRSQESNLSAVIPLRAISREDELALSFAQQRLWFLNQLEEQNTTYNISSGFHLNGTLNEVVLQQSIAEIVERHEILRTTFSVVDGVAVQVIHPNVNITISSVNLEALPDVEQAAEVQRLVKEESQRPFDLVQGPLLRLTLLRLGRESHIFLLTIHHIISDGWSMGIFFRELSHIYKAFSGGESASLPKLPLQYADFAHWQKNWLQGEVLEIQFEYWKQQLVGVPPLLDLPTDRPRPPVQTFRGSTKTFELSGTLTQQLKKLGSQSGTTLFMTLLAAFVTLLGRYSNQEDIVVGSPIAGRNRSEIESLIGFFVNTLVLRVDLSGNPSFRELLRRTRQVTLDAYSHQDLPFEKLVEELQPERNLSYNPLFQVMFVLQNAGSEDWEFPGLTLTPLEIESVTAKFDLTLAMEERESGLRGVLEYNSDLFDGTTISRMLGHFQTLLEGIVANPEQRLLALPLLTEAERHQLLVEWNDTQAEYPRDKCIHHLFEEQVEKAPDAVALVFEDERLTYRELNARANQLAHYLQKLGVESEKLVGICVERSIEMIVGLLGILKAGGAYVPLASDYPQERLAFMIGDSQVTVLLTQEKLVKHLPQHQAQVICLDTNWEKISSGSQENSVTEMNPENLAYVIYTSGSTGRPKGAMNSHRGLVNRLLWMQDVYQLTASDRVLQKTPFSFDVSVWEIFWPLITGVRLVMTQTGGHQDSAYLVNLIIQQQITTLHFVPSMLQVFLEEKELEKCASLRQVICSGEILFFDLQERFFARLGNCELHNLYGPTEAAIDVTFYQCQRGSRQKIVPIGCPITNTQIYILDSNLQPVPLGMKGELHIGGVQLARGYLNCPDLTAEKFIPNPFNNEPNAKLYKTGDLVRYLSDGNIEFLGRLDNQVKIRGFRIELGEIEAVLGQHPALRECVVIAQGDDVESKRLVAYVVKSQETINISELRHFLKQKLPDYMIPLAFVVLEAIPLTPNGKIDRKALPIPDSSYFSLEASFVAPRTSIEEVLAAIWSNLLGLEQVGIHDNFFELGGHSLLATQVISRLRETFSVELPVRCLFEAPTIAELGESIEASRSQTPSLLTPAIVPVPREGEIPLSFAQQRLWFIDQLEGTSGIYNIPLALRLIGKLDKIALERAIQEVVQRHEVLRTTFERVNGSPVQVIGSTWTGNVSVVDLRGLTEEEQAAEVRRLGKEEALRAFDLVKGPLLRVTLLQLGEQSHVLLLTMHHIVSDGWSIGIFQREFSSLYTAFSQGNASPLPNLSIQYADFADWQRQWLSGEVLESKLNYWKQQLQGIPPLLELPTDRPRPPAQTFQGSSESFELSVELTQKLKTLSQKAEATLFMALLGAFVVLLSRYSGQEDIVVGSPIANRNRVETESLIGFFVNSLVLRANLAGGPTFQDLLKQVRQVALDAYGYQDVPFEQVVEALQPERSLSHSPLFQVMFVLQNAPKEKLELPDLTLIPLEIESTVAKFDLTLLMQETEQGLKGKWQYNTDLFDAATICRMSGHFQTLLEGIVANPQQRVSKLPLLTEAERHQLLVKWNDTQAEFPQDKCIHHLFEEQVEKTPDAIAVVFEDQELTYRELNCRANQLAHYLRSLGVEPEVLVGIYVERSPEMIVGLLGILKAGGSYVPLDANYPQERLAFMLEDSQVSVLLTQQKLVEKLPEHQAQLVCLDSDWKVISQKSNNNLCCGVKPENIAYVIYTSGSTGTPKGVLLAHQGLCSLALAQKRLFHVCSESRVLQFASLSFDASIWEIVMALTAGARLCLGTQESLLPGQSLKQLLRQQEITHITLPPSALAVLPIDEKLSALNTIIVAGETCSREIVVKWSKGRHFFNAYGPTESTVCATVAECDDDSDKLSIGRPIANIQIYILDRHLQLVPIGVPGELHIGGAGLARGYLNRPDLTTEKFIPNPFSNEPTAKLYKTGDLARYRTDGNIEFLGRIDNQVKIRGFRIELGEVEAVLGQHPAVRESVVVAPGDDVENKRLVAYLIPSQETISISELRCFLKLKLPDYMVPSAFMFLEAMPLTPNGKVDRRALPIPDSSHLSRESSFVPPRTPTEEVLAAIWSNLLGVEQVGIHDNFFELGGHSLLATQLMFQISDIFHCELSLNTLLKRPNIIKLGAYIDGQGKIMQDYVINLEPKLLGGSLPLLLTQHRRWILEESRDDNKSFTNICLAIRITGSLNVTVLQQVFNEIVRRHEALRANFVEVQEQPTQVIRSEVILSLPVIDLRNIPDIHRELEIQQYATQEFRQRFNLTKEPLIRLKLLWISDKEHILLVTIEHIIFDGWSLNLFLKETSLLYESFSNGIYSPLPEPSVQYSDFVFWQQKRLEGQYLVELLNYWTKQLDGASPLLELPGIKKRSISGKRQEFSLSSSLHKSLKDISKSKGVSLFMTLLAVFQLLLHQYTGKEDILVATSFSNRVKKDFKNIIGYFTNVQILRTNFSGVCTFSELLSRVREVVLGAYSHQEWPFALTSAQPPLWNETYLSLFQVMFTLQYESLQPLSFPDFKSSYMHLDIGVSKFVLYLIIKVRPEGLSGVFYYSKDLFNDCFITQMSKDLVTLLELIGGTVEIRVK
jgi:amino acid adenylation domain-containing protein